LKAPPSDDFVNDYLMIQSTPGAITSTAGGFSTRVALTKK